MNNKRLKRIIVYLIILLIIILLAVIVLFKKKIKSDPEFTEEAENVLLEYGKIESGGVDYQSYFDIKTCMQKFVNNINIKNSKYYVYDKTNHKLIVTNENEIKQNIYDLLSDKYIAEKNITLNNLYNNVKTIEQSATYLPVEAGLIQDGDIKSFAVYGLVQSNADYSVICKLFTIVNINVIDGKFSIEPLYENYNSISEIKIKDNEKTITANNNNKFKMTSLTPESYPNEYLKTYKGLALGLPEKLYDLLEKDYKNSRFANYEEFRKFIEKNRDKIQSIRLEKYQVETGTNDVRYICVDQYQNYYVINQKEILQDYTIMLDTYTIDLPEFIKKYDSSQNKIRVALNIEKLVDATKMGDYKYIYNKMNESFRNNNFGTVEKFEKYMLEKFDATNDTIEYEKYEEVTGVHVYNIVLTDKSENKTVKAKVVMDLKENRDFEFSFSAEK